MHLPHLPDRDLGRNHGERPRKNSLSYKSEPGVEVGDLFMSLNHTCRLNAIKPFDYLVALARHLKELAANPDRWLPWTYADTVASNTI